VGLADHAYRVAPLTVSVAESPSQNADGPLTLIFNPLVIVKVCASVVTQPVTASVTVTEKEYVANDPCGNETVTADESMFEEVMSE